MTTFDPDTLVQDRGVLQHIVDDLDASIALDCSVVRGGTIRVGDTVELIPAGPLGACAAARNAHASRRPAPATPAAPGRGSARELVERTRR